VSTVSLRASTSSSTLPQTSSSSPPPSSSPSPSSLASNPVPTSVSPGSKVNTAIIVGGEFCRSAGFKSFLDN
jgi:hypothetical protein